MLKKIRTQEEVARTKKRNQFLVGGVLIVLMVVSTLGYSLMSGDRTEGESSDSVSELGLNFVQSGGFWRVSFGDATLIFQYLPSEVENVSVNGSYDFEDYSGKVLYFVNANEGASEILSNLRRYVLRYQEACLNGSVCEGDLPVKNCEDNLIIFEPGNETSVWKNESCVYIVGDSIRGADVFLYKVLKID